MFNGSRFFNLARKWKKQQQKGKYISIIHFHILQAVMDHYFARISGYSNNNPSLIELDSVFYPVNDIAFVLDSVGYHNYIIQTSEEINKTLIYL